MSEFDLKNELLALARDFGSKRANAAETLMAAAEALDATAPPPASFTPDALEELAYEMSDILMGHSGRDCSDMLLELIGRPRLPPIQHPYGTYLWAREACARLPSSARGVESKSAGWAVMVPVTVAQWNEMKWPHAAFVATDWEVMP